MSNNESGDRLEATVVLVLFHNDLRVHDNATLIKAAQLAGANTCLGNDNDNNNNDNHTNDKYDNDNHDGRLILLYAPTLASDLQPKNWGKSYQFNEMGQARRLFLEESLLDLNQSLQDLGNSLLYVATAEQLYRLIEEQGVTDICVSQSADYAQNLAYKTLQTKYPQIRWHRQATVTLFATMPTKKLPQSFTQFRKKVEYDHDLLSAEQDLDICQTPTTLAPMPENLLTKSSSSENSAQSCEYTFKLSSFAEQASLHLKREPNFQGGETSALAHLNDYFDSTAPSTYKTTRNAMDEWTHSTKFSAWLANGSLSVKTLLNRLRQYEREVVANDSTYWIWFELLWREYFYWYAVTHQKNLFLFQGISSQPPPTHYDKQRLEQWQKGETAYPIVNACMQQLNHTGYMSNRGRQLVASAFIHELGLDWRYGATYFEQQLIDYDVGSNWGNWQYLAGVGADPRGCRQFNLKKQTQQHDPNGDFRDKWLS